MAGKLDFTLFKHLEDLAKYGAKERETLLKPSEVFREHKGKTLKGLQYDRQRVNLDANDYGGPEYSELSLSSPLHKSARAVAAVSNKGAATRILNQFQFEPQGSIIHTPILGSEIQHRGNPNNFKKFHQQLLQKIEQGEVPPEQVEAINDRLNSMKISKNKKMVPLFSEEIDVADPNFSKDATTFEQRTHFADTIFGKGVGGVQGRSVDIMPQLRESIDPYVADAPMYSFGHRIVQLEPKIITDARLHKDYPENVVGTDLEVRFKTIPHELMPDFKEKVRRETISPEFPEGRDPLPIDFRTKPFSQKINDSWIELLEEHGLAEGGEVHMAPGGGVGKAVKALLEGAGGKEVKQSTEAAKQINRIAGADVSTKKDLLDVNDFHAGMMDEIRRRAAETKKQMESFEYSYGPGDNIFTEWSAKNNRAPYKVLDRGMTSLKMLGRDEQGNKMYAPRKPAYWVESEHEDGVQRYLLPAEAIKGKVDVENYSKGGNVKDVQHFGKGGFAAELAKRMLKAQEESKALEAVKSTPAVSRIDMNFKDVTKRIPELQKAANLLDEGKLSASEYDKLVNAFKPVEAYSFVPSPASYEDAMRALNKNQKPMYGMTSEIPEGTQTDLRLDIPSYRDHGVWINSVHRKKQPTVYDSVSSVKNATMIGSPDKAIKVAKGEGKAPFAVISGEWNPIKQDEAVSKAQEYLNHPEWTQVGYDPERHGYFYDRATMEPIEGAEEVIQIGPLVLAKKPVYGEKKKQKYAGGGKVDLEQEFIKADSFEKGGSAKAKAQRKADDDYTYMTTDPVGYFMDEMPMYSKPTIHTKQDFSQPSFSNILETLYKTFKNNPDNRQLQETITGMNPIVRELNPFYTVPRGLKTLSTVKGAPIAKAAMNNLRGINDDEVYRQAGEEEITALEGLFDMAPALGLAKLGAKPVMKGINKIADMNLPVGLSIKDVSTPQHHPYIGYINKEGKHELFNEKLAKDADYHHSNLVKDLNEYDKDSTLRFVRNNSENRYSLLGDSAIDPYHPDSKKQITELAKLLQQKGADPNAPFVIEHMALPHTEAPYQGKEIGKLSDWYTAPPKSAEFRSSLVKSVNSHKMDTMPGAQWASWLQANGSKSAKKEAEATGLYDWLKTQPKVTKYDIEEHIGENLPKTETKVLSGVRGFNAEEKKQFSELQRKAYDLNKDVFNIQGMEPDDVVEYARLSNKMHKQNLDSLQKRYDDMKMISAIDPELYVDNTNHLALYKARIDNFNPEDIVVDKNAVKYPTRVEPGGKNYKETIVSLPASGKLPEGFKVVETFDDEGKPFYHAETPSTKSGKWRDRSYAEDQLATYAKNLNSANAYESSHYSGIDNPLFHIRTNERLTPEGKKALFMEELQSDWAQQGRDKGFVTPLTSDEKKELDELSKMKYSDENTSYLGKELSSQQELRYDDLIRKESKSRVGLPSGPYVTDTKDWTALGLKHALKQAVDEGHDYLAWTTGAQQADRYNLRKQINEIHYSGSNLKAYDHDGNEVVSQTGIRKEDLPDYIGKEATEKLLAQPMNGTLRSLQGEELEVGGEGMKGFYDQIVPQTMNDVMKQIGAKERVKPINVQMERGVVNSDQPDYGIPIESQHLGIEITPELREQILNEGLPHFHEGGEVDARTVKRGKIKPIDLETEFKLSKFKE